jgi:hypothetical protein
MSLVGQRADVKTVEVLLQEARQMRDETVRRGLQMTGRAIAHAMRRFLDAFNLPQHGHTLGR